MISSQIHQEVPGLDVVLQPSDPDFGRTGLKKPSVIRVTRLAVVASGTLQGAVRTLVEPRLRGIRARLAEWLCSERPRTATYAEHRRTADREERGG